MMVIPFLSITNVGNINSDFRDVLVSPGLASNLLSVGQLVVILMLIFHVLVVLCKSRCRGKLSRRGLKWEDCFRFSLFLVIYLLLVIMF